MLLLRRAHFLPAIFFLCVFTFEFHSNYACVGIFDCEFPFNFVKYSHKMQNWLFFVHIAIYSGPTSDYASYLNRFAMVSNSTFAFVHFDFDRVRCMSEPPDLL